MRSRTGASPQRRIAMAMLAVGMVASMQLVGPLHYLLVAHYHCADHGELTHASGGHSHDTAEADDGGRAEVPALGVSNRATEHASHEHCAVATHERSQVTLADAAWTQLVPPSRVEVDGAQPLPRHVADAPIDSAPKTSPPVAG